VRIGNPKDFWSGAFAVALGVFAAAYAAVYLQIGTAQRMGPGYFPLCVGGIIAVLGVVLVLRSLRGEGPPIARFQWRPILLVLPASIAYGYLLKPLGLVAATLVLVLVAAAAGKEFRWKESVLLAVVLAVFSVGIFVYALGLPFPLWPELLE
jgi:putative tricarboxylic transport membrane protein